MRAEEIRELLDAQPFRPFRIYMTDGKTYDIRHPELIVVFRTKVQICFPDDPVRRIFDHAEHCALLQIVRVEELQALATA